MWQALQVAVQLIPAEPHRRDTKKKDDLPTYPSAADQPESLCPCTRPLMASGCREEG